MRFKEAQTRFFPDPMPSVPDTSKKVKSILDPFIVNCPEIVNESIFQPLNYINAMNPYIMDVVEGRFQNMFKKNKLFFWIVLLENISVACLTVKGKILHNEKRYAKTSI